MYPYSLQIGSISIGCYAGLYILAYTCAVAWILLQSRKAGISRVLVLQYALLALVAGLCGARLYYVVFYFREALQDPSSALNSDTGVLGVIAVLFPLSYWFWNRSGVDVWSSADLIAPSLVLMAAIGRIGCLAAGCCFGVPSESFLRVVFAASTPAGHTFPGQLVVPTQFFQAVNCGVLFLLGNYLYRRKAFDGEVFTIVLFGYALDRFVIDFYRYYPPAEMIGSGPLTGIPFTQVGAFLLMAVALWVWLVRKPRSASVACGNS